MSTTAALDVGITSPIGRGAVITWVRQIIHGADPDITEATKRRGAPVWSHDGNIVVANRSPLGAERFWW